MGVMRLTLSHFTRWLISVTSDPTADLSTPHTCISCSCVRIHILILDGSGFRGSRSLSTWIALIGLGLVALWIPPLSPLPFPPFLPLSLLPFLLLILLPDVILSRPGTNIHPLQWHGHPSPLTTQNSLEFQSLNLFHSVHFGYLANESCKDQYIRFVFFNRR